MKDVALIIVNTQGELETPEMSQKVDEIAKFIDGIESVNKDSDEVIFGTFPILFVGDTPKALESFESEGLTFKVNKSDLFSSKNEAEQKLNEILEMLDIHNAYVCGLASEAELATLSDALVENGIKVLNIK